MCRAADRGTMESWKAPPTLALHGLSGVGGADLSIPPDSRELQNRRFAGFAFSVRAQSRNCEALFVHPVMHNPGHAVRPDRPNRHRPLGTDRHLAIAKPQRAVSALGLHRWAGQPAVLVLGGVGQRPVGCRRGGCGVRPGLAQGAVGALAGTAPTVGRWHPGAAAREPLEWTS